MPLPRSRLRLLVPTAGEYPCIGAIGFGERAGQFRSQFA